MALQYVGGIKANLSAPVSLTALTGGIDTEARAGDIVVAARVGTDGSFGTITGSYSNAQVAIGSDSDDVRLSVDYKIMGGTPDTTFNVPSPVNDRAVIIQVWRGVNTTTPMDVAAVTINGANSINPNPDPITPVTAGAIVIIAGAGADRGNGIAVTTHPSGYTNTAEQLGTNGAAYWCIGVMASKAWSGSGAEDPAAWVMNGTDTGCSWGAITVALRPILSTNYTKDLTETVTLVENVLKLPAKRLLEVITLVETVLKKPQKIFLETVALVENLFKQPAKSLLETVTLVEVFSRVHTAFRSFVETITLVEVTDLTLIFIKTLQETITLIDTTAEKITAKILQETVALVDSVTTMATMFRSLLETITLDAAINTVGAMFRSLTETLVLVDVDIKRTTSKVFSETLPLQDTIARAVIYARSFLETITLAEVFAKVKGYNRGFTETVTLVDSLTRIPVKNLFESIALTERFRGLLNGNSIEYIKKYISQAGSYVKKYTDQAGTYIKKYLDLP